MSEESGQTAGNIMVWKYRDVQRVKIKREMGKMEEGVTKRVLKEKKQRFIKH